MKAPDPNQHTLSGSPELHLRVRAALLVNGVTLTDWCQKNRTSRQFAYQCLVGKRGGKSAAQLLDQIISAAGIS
nr:hypothetical protein [uncultured Rhodopila sp.]